jgi:hypothetical protein
MTLRLVLVGLVAALGLTIPQLSDQMSSEGATRITTAEPSKHPIVGAKSRPIRSVVVDHRILRSSNFYARQRFQPVGYGSGVVRPSSKLVTNFWQVPNGSRVVSTSPTVVEAPAPDVAKTVRPDFEPIEVDDVQDLTLADALNRGSEGLPVVIQGPPSRLKVNVVAAEVQPRRSLVPMMDVYRAIEKVASRPNKMETDEAREAATWPEDLKMVVTSVAGTMSDRIEQSRRMLWASWKTLNADLRASSELSVATAVVPAAPRSEDWAMIPDDVFAPEMIKVPSGPVALADLPDDVFAPEMIKVPSGPVALADLPDDVFAPEMIKVPSEPVAFADLPDDVFAPVVSRPSPVVASATTPELTTSAGPGLSRVIQGPEHLTEAVSLTREAAVAWMKLLSGPAVVTVHR